MRAGRLPESHPLEQLAREALRQKSPRALDAMEAERLDRMRRDARWRSEKPQVARRWES